MRSMAAILGTIFSLALISIDAHAEQSILWECKGVRIDQKGPSTVPIGGRMTYEIVIHNDGSCNLTGASVVDFIPRTSIYEQASPQPTVYPELYSPVNGAHPVPRVEWKNVELGAGKEIYFSISARAQSSDARVLLNTICFEHNQAGRICSQVETTVTRE